MGNAMKMIAGALVAVTLAAAALADGMIVPVDPEIRVRGSWSVKYHRVDMIVRDQVAAVTIDQEFVNTGSGMIEVEYLFPVPPRAAIDAMTMVVNGKEFTGRLLRAEEARRIYEDIVRRKKDPALLEYVGFGLYRTKAFPLAPGKPAKVLVHYNHPSKKDFYRVEVFYPLNTEKFSARAIEEVSVTADIKAAGDITAIYSPTHDIQTERKSPRHVVVTYSVKGTIPNTDFVVLYKAKDEDVGATLLTYQPDPQKDGYFMLLASPNPRISQGAVQPKDIVLLVDRSGSMNSNNKMKQAKEALSYVLQNLNPDDRFDVVTYSDWVEPFFKELTFADEAAVNEALERAERIEAMGGTNIHDAVAKAM